MINDLSVLAFIPARGGSKGLPNKNILKLNNKELIAYTIEAAKKSGVCDMIIVSTDSEKIADISKKYGASVPFKRPKYLANDNSKMIDVILHAIKWFENNNKKFDIFLYLQPTSPLRSEMHILEAFSVFFNKNADSIISINKSMLQMQRINTLDKDLTMTNFVNSKYEYLNRQELPQYYELNGAIHIARWKILKESKSWFVEKSFGYILDEPYYLDIDCKLSFDFIAFQMEKGYVKK